MALGNLGKPGLKPATEVQDPGFFYPASYLLPRFDVWIKSKFQVWPNGKAYDEQPEKLVRDFHTLLKMFNWWLEQLK
jgi:hypothetical protein